MTSAKSHQLDRILNNKTLGSSELLQRLNSYFISIQKNKATMVKAIRLAKIKLKQFEAVNSYLKEISYEMKTGRSLSNFLSNQSSIQKEKIEIIFSKLYPDLRKISSVITLSRSGTVVEILKLWHNRDKKIKVIVCESRPKLEGRLMAESLTRVGIKTTLITDAMMNLYVPKVEAAIIGADVVLNNGNIVNKVGSKSLAILCKEYRNPFYVVTSKSKFTKKKIFISKKEDQLEIWDKKLKNLSIHNVYFEDIEKKLITKIFTD